MPGALCEGRPLLTSPTTPHAPTFCGGRGLHEARGEYRRVIGLTTNVAERGFLEGRLSEVGA